MLNLFSKLAEAYCNANLIVRILIGLIIGVILGVTIPDLTFVAILGKLFVGALKAMAPVLVLVLVVSSVAKARNGLGKRFSSVITLYMASTLIAAVIAVFASFLFPITLKLPGVETVESVPNELKDVFMALATDLISNPLLAVSNAMYLSILFWAIVIGVALRKKASNQTIDCLHDLAETITLVVQWIIRCAPFGILGLVYTSVSESGIEIFTTYGKLVLLLVGCMMFTSLIINPIISSLMLRRNAYPLLWRCLKESAVNAFFTRSSAANLPVNLTLCQRLGLSEDFYSVSIPLGCTINMDGAAVTITVMTLATCFTQGIDVSLGSALTLSVLATLAACGSSGVPGGSLLLIPMACSLFGISQDISMQVVAVGFIISVIQDSVETALNSSGDVMFTATADFYERQKAGEKIDF